MEPIVRRWESLEQEGQPEKLPPGFICLEKQL